MKLFSCLLFGLLLLVPGTSFAFEMLTDEQLDNVTAGSYDPSAQGQEVLTRIPFRYSSGKGQVDGEVIVMPRTSFDQTASLQLMDNAQSNLSSLININAVNSPIQVLLNLNINLNSTVGSLNQWNQQLDRQ
ncbi:MAG: hypothetical protein QNK24_11945 [Desulfuromusa sp.]|nr:hypothetical protein [Desulfuromusa sp.]